MIIQAARACLEQSNFFQSKHSQEHYGDSPPGRGGTSSRTPRGIPQAHFPRPAMTFLTSATLIYAIGAGFTAAADTRLFYHLKLNTSILFIIRSNLLSFDSSISFVVVLVAVVVD